MNGTSGREWDQILERADLEMSDADLAAAERALRILPGDEVVQIRPEWLAATMASATAPIVEEPAPVKFALVRRAAARVQAAAAAVLAVVGIHSATAATVTAVTVGTVTTVALVSALWPEGEMSHETMDYAQAVAILMDATEPVAAREAAMFQVSSMVGTTLKLLGDVESSSLAGSPLAMQAASRRVELIEVLRSDNPQYYSPGANLDVEALFAAVGNAGAEPDARAQSLASMSELALGGASALRGMPSTSASLAQARDQFIRGVLRRAGVTGR